MNRPSLLLLVSFAFVLVAAAPARADFPLGLQRSGPVADVGGATAACGRDDCLVIWSSSAGPIAMRTSLAGEPLLDRGIVLAATPSRGVIGLATDGSRYLVALLDTADYQRPFVVFATVEADGRIVPRSTMPWYAYSPSRPLTLLWNRGLFVAIYDAGDSVRAAVLDDAGTLLADRPIVQKTAYYDEFRAATAGERLVLARTVFGGVSVSLFTAREILEPSFTAWPGAPLSGLAPNSGLTGVASTGTELLIVSRRFEESWHEVGYAQVFGLDGKAVGPERRLGNGGWSAAPMPGGGYLAVTSLAGQLSRSVVAVRISAAGDALDAAPFPVAPAGDDQSFASAVPNAAGTLLLWTNGRSNLLGGSIRSEVVDGQGGRRHAGIADGGVLVSRGLATQAQPVVAQRNDGSLFAWIERTDRDRLVLARYDAAGRPLDSEPAAVHESTFPQHNPVLATDGRGAFVAWQEGGGVTYDAPDRLLYAAFIAPGSTRAEAVVIDSIAKDSGPAAVVCNGRQYVLAWQSVTTRQLLMVRWTLDGTRIDSTPIAFGPARTYSSWGTLGDAAPALAWNGREYYIAFGHEAYEYPPAVFEVPPTIIHELHGARLTEDLIRTGPEQLLSLPEDEGGPDAGRAAVIASGDRFLVAWSQRQNWFDPGLIAARAVLPNGELSPLRGRARTSATPPSLIAFGDGARIAFGNSLHQLDRDAAFVAERIEESPVAAATADGARLLLVESRLVDNVPRLFVVTLPGPRARAVR